MAEAGELFIAESARDYVRDALGRFADSGDPADVADALDGHLSDVMRTRPRNVNGASRKEKERLARSVAADMRATVRAVDSVAKDRGKVESATRALDAAESPTADRDAVPDLLTSAIGDLRSALGIVDADADERGGSGAPVGLAIPDIYAESVADGGNSSFPVLLAEEFNPDQARDDAGRWTAGGGGASVAGEKGGASDGPKTGSDPGRGYLSADWTGPRRNWIPTPTGLPEHSIDAQLVDPPTGPNDPAADDKRMRGELKDPERKALHAKLVSEALASTHPVPDDENPVAILTIGGAGSGKSSMMKGIDKSKFVSVDPDGIKEKLPEYKEFTKPSGTWDGAAYHVHEESSRVAKQIREEALSSRRNVIIDGTGANADGMSKTIDALKQRGYSVTLMMPDIDVEDALGRVARRAEDNGRLVPEDVVRKQYAKIPKNFRVLAEKADDAVLVDNRGKKPRPVYERRGGKETVHDPAAWDKFGK